MNADINWRRVVTVAAAVVIPILVLALSVVLFGPGATVLYAILFVVGAALIPTMVAMLGSTTPNMMGTLEFTLGQVAFGRGWLVEHENEWQMHPGRTVDGQEQVWLDGKWRAVPDASNQTILGWQPFGLLLRKDAETLADARYDAEGEVRRERQLGSAATDGGSDVVRGGVPEATPPADRDIYDDEWILDLKRYWSRGLEQMGDIALLEKEEEVTMRDEATSGKSSRRTMLIGSLVGLVLGAATAWVAMGGMG